MNVGIVLTVLVSVILVMAVAVKQWEKYERKKLRSGMKSGKRRFFRNR